MQKNIKKVESRTRIIEIGKALPITNLNLDELFIEWSMLLRDKDVCSESKENERIDFFWHKIFQLKNLDKPRYTVIPRVLKCILSLPHRQADVEHGFSTSHLLMPDNSTRMGLRMLDAKLIIADAIKRYDSLTYKVPIIGELIKLGHSAYRSYQTYLDEQKRLEEDNKKQKALDAERSEKERIMIENLSKEENNLQNLEEKRDKLKKFYNEIVAKC